MVTKIKPKCYTCHNPSFPASLADSASRQGTDLDNQSIAHWWKDQDAQEGGELGFSKNLSKLLAPIQPLVPKVTRELPDKSFAT